MAIEQEHEEFLKLVPQDGSTIGNKTLREKLKWEEEKYWKIRDELIHEGLIRKALGKGGAVARVEIKPDAQLKENSILQQDIKDPFKDEKSLYKPFLNTIELKFTKDMGIKSFVCEDISAQGRKSTGGMWTRPDIILVSVSTYSYFPGKVMDVISFELKHHKNVSVAGVFETASQSRYANKSYFCLYLPGGFPEKNEDFERIQNECERFGVGLLVFSDPKNYDTFEVIVEPERKDPDPNEINNFILVQMGDKQKQRIGEMLR